MTKKILGYDVSENNNFTLNDFQTMVNNGAEFIVIRSSYGRHSQDSKFLEITKISSSVLIPSKLSVSSSPLQFTLNGLLIMIL